MGLDMSLLGDHSQELISWRKANYIHRFFTGDRYFDNDINCTFIPIPYSKLEELRNICKTILIDRDQAPKLLPTCEGFFFGSKEYNENYFYNIVETLTKLEIILYKYDPEFTFQYYADW